MDSGGQWRDSDKLHTLWAAQRKTRPPGFADPGHPFRHQGSADLNTYKMFLEFARALLDREGRLGMIVPSGIYSDKGSTELRELFLNESRWEWLFGFENREKVFDIDSRFKFGPVIVQKGGKTESIHAAFMRHDLGDWEDGEAHALAYPRDRVEQFSPNTRAILELQSSRDLEILEKIYANSVLLGDDGPDGWGITYSREFDMTNDSKLFPPRPQWEAKGYAPDEYGHWLKGAWRPVTDFGFREGKSLLDPQYQHWSILDRPDGLVLSRDGTQAMSLDDLQDVALPLYQGVMIGQFDYTRKAWLSGTGLRAKWEPLTWSEKHTDAQFLMSRKTYAEKAVPRYRVGFRDIARSTDSRTMICAALPPYPCGNKVPTLSTQGDPFALAALLNSWVFDWQERIRQGSASINYYIIEETPLIKPEVAQLLVGISMKLGAIAPVFSPALLNSPVTTRSQWATTAASRRRLRAIADALVASLYGLKSKDLAHILANTGLPVAALATPSVTKELPSKGFWRSEKDLAPECRHSVLSLDAMRVLEEQGLQALDSWRLDLEVLEPWQELVEDDAQFFERHAAAVKTLLGHGADTLKKRDDRLEKSQAEMWS